MTQKQYLADSTTLCGTVTVTEIILGGERPIVRTDSSWFHPQGGGQKADRGTLGASNVLHVVHNGGDTDHYVDSVAELAPNSRYSFSIDPAWRMLNAAYHTAGHLIANLVEANFAGVSAVSGHQWPGEARVQFEGELPAPEKLGTLLPGYIREALNSKARICIIGDPYSGRTIKIGDFPVIPCGGTHLPSLEYLADIRITGVKRKSDQLRVSYEAHPVAMGQFP